MRTSTRTALLLVSLVPAVSSCTGGTGGSAPDARASLPAVYAEQFDRHLAGSLTDLEREILEDYRITDAEYATVREGFRRCAEDAGYVVELGSEGFSVAASPALRESLSEDEQADGMDAVVAACEPGWTEKVGMLYEQMRHDPDPTDPLDDIRDCLRRHDLPGADLSDDELHARVAELDASGTDEVTAACMADPVGF